MNKKILVVDDDDSVRKSISAALKLKGGFETLEAEDGLTGLELAKQHHPDLIISDVVMENFNGFRMLETLKEYEETADIPIIMMTTHEQIDKEWKTGSAVEYLSKGFTLDVLLEKVNLILSK
ncbi:MAG: response regulator [Bacteroidota bacterium]|jgi:CheY-like chemotaxis protein